jgi:hypothetical protein
MAPFYDGFNPKFELHSDDISGIRRLYPLREGTTGATESSVNFEVDEVSTSTTPTSYSRPYPTRPPFRTRFSSSRSTASPHTMWTGSADTTDTSATKNPSGNPTESPLGKPITSPTFNLPRNPTANPSGNPMTNPTVNPSGNPNEGASGNSERGFTISSILTTTRHHHTTPLFYPVNEPEMLDDDILPSKDPFPPVPTEDLTTTQSSRSSTVTRKHTRVTSKTTLASTGATFSSTQEFTLTTETLGGKEGTMEQTRTTTVQPMELSSSSTTNKTEHYPDFCDPKFVIDAVTTCDGIGYLFSGKTCLLGGPAVGRLAGNLMGFLLSFI